MLHHEREELYAIFDSVMHYNHPGCVIKHVDGDFDPYMVIGEKLYHGKRYIICFADLRMENPPAKHLYRNLLQLEK